MRVSMSYTPSPSAYASRDASPRPGIFDTTTFGDEGETPKYSSCSLSATPADTAFSDRSEYLIPTSSSTPLSPRIGRHYSGRPLPQTPSFTPVTDFNAVDTRLDRRGTSPDHNRPEESAIFTSSRADTGSFKNTNYLVATPLSPVECLSSNPLSPDKGVGEDGLNSTCQLCVVGVDPVASRFDQNIYKGENHEGCSLDFIHRFRC